MASGQGKEFDENVCAFTPAPEFVVPDDGSSGVGNSVLFVTLTNDGNDNYTADKTVAEITDAYNNGVMCYVKIVMNGTTLLVPLTYIGDISGMTVLMFCSLLGGSGSGGFDVTSIMITGAPVPTGDMWTVQHEIKTLQLLNN